MKVTGKLLVYDKVNLNGRIYTLECTESIVKQFGEITSGNKCMFGQLGYPSSDRFTDISDKPSHKIEELHIDENSKSLMGTIEILDTPEGKHLKRMIDMNIDTFNQLFVVRPRGIGNVNEEGIVENFQILSFDVVPKKDDAFLNLE